MNQEHINKMIDKIVEKREKSIRIIDDIVHTVIDKYNRLHKDGNDVIDDNDFSSDEKNSIDIITDLSSKPNWHNTHDNIWRIFLELKHSNTFRSLSQFAEINLNQLEKDIDMPSIDNIRTVYESKYLDSPELKYDGDLLICNPSDFISEKEHSLCPSLYTRHTLNNDTPYYVVTDMENNMIGTVCAATEICVVLAKDIWNIPSANDALRRCDVNDYTFIKQFHGTVKFYVEQIDNKYILRIEGNGNKPFKLNRAS